MTLKKSQGALADAWEQKDALKAENANLRLQLAEALARIRMLEASRRWLAAELCLADSLHDGNKSYSIEDWIGWAEGAAEEEDNA